VTDRQDPYERLGIGETMAVTSGRGKRDRSWEREQRQAPEVCQVSYRNIPRSVRDRIKKIAQGHQVTSDQVARRLLEYGLEQYEAGAVTIETRAEAVKYVVRGTEAP